MLIWSYYPQTLVCRLYSASGSQSDGYSGEGHEFENISVEIKKNNFSLKTILEEYSVFQNFRQLSTF